MPSNEGLRLSLASSMPLGNGCEPKVQRSHSLIPMYPLIEVVKLIFIYSTFS